MNDRRIVEEELGVIRTLLERAATYRATAARVALVGGLLSTLAAGAIYLKNETSITGGRPIRSRQFALIWIAVFILTLAAKIFFVWREARKAGRPLDSAGLKIVVRAIAPCLVIPAVFTGWFLTSGYLGGDRLTLVVIWLASYGLALLSTQSFAPRPISLLGWTFLLTSLAVPVVLDATAGTSWPAAPNLIMGLTFGLYHLIYAASTWPRKGDLRDQ
jgi:hypothetical protein